MRHAASGAVAGALEVVAHDAVRLREREHRQQNQAGAEQATDPAQEPVEHPEEAAGEDGDGDQPANDDEYVHHNLPWVASIARAGMDFQSPQRGGSAAGLSVCSTFTPGLLSTLR